MKEINEMFYCSAGAYTEVGSRCEFSNENGLVFDAGVCRKKRCPYYHRKYPTPEQYREEYGEEWKGAAYYHCTQEGCDTECDAKEWTTKEHGCLHKPIIVCACTPIGKPPSGWRPK